MTSHSAVTLESVYLVVLMVAIFFVAATFALRASCGLANGIGGWSGRFARLEPPSYRACLVIILLPVIVLSIAGGVEESLVVMLAANGIDEDAVRLAVSILEWFAFAGLVAVGLSETQPVRNRLILIAASLHACLLVAGLYGLAYLIAVFVG